MSIIRRITYDHCGNTIDVKDFEATPVEHDGKLGHFVVPVYESAKIANERPDIIKKPDPEKQFIQNCEYTLTLAREFSRRIMKV